MSRLLLSLRHREEGVGHVRPQKVLERNVPSRLVMPIGSVVDRQREILRGGCSLLGFLKGPVEGPIGTPLGSQYLLAYTKALEEQEYGSVEATYGLQVWGLGLGGPVPLPLEKEAEWRLFRGCTVVEDTVRLLLTFVETRDGDYILTHGYPAPLVATNHHPRRPTHREDGGGRREGDDDNGESEGEGEGDDDEEGRLCFMTVVKSPLFATTGSSRQAIHFSYTLFAPYPPFEPLQCVLPDNILLFNTAEAIHVLHFGDHFDAPLNPSFSVFAPTHTSEIELLTKGVCSSLRSHIGPA